MGIEYAENTLTQVVGILATGAGRIQERLRDAATLLINVRSDDIPDVELRRRFDGIVDDLTYEQSSQGSISASLKATDDEDARAIAGRIFDLYQAIHRVVYKL